MANYGQATADAAIRESAADHPPLQPTDQFMTVEAAGGLLLLAAAIVAIVLANSPAADAMEGFWKLPLGLQVAGFGFRHSIRHFIDDGLMTIFFFVIGLEVKREIVHGELGDLQRAALPVAGACGGMIVPACVYLAVLRGASGGAARGWGICMATDIAFVVGCMAMLGKRIPHGLRSDRIEHFRKVLYNVPASDSASC